MKQQLFKKLSLLFIGSILFSCSLEEEYVEKQQYQQTSKYSIERKSLQELLKNQKFSTAFSQLPKQDIKITGSIAGRTVMEQDYGFTISENIPAQVMSTKYLTSYTFHITRDIPAIDFFENLVIQTDTLGTTKAYIVKYSLDGAADYFAEHDSYIVDGQRELTSILYNANDAQAKIQYMGNDDCTIYTLMCPYGHPHPASLICIGEGQDVYWTYDSSNCGSGSGNTGDSGSGGDSGTGDSGSDSGGGGNTGGTPGDEDYDDGLVDPKTCKGCGGVVTVPVPELEQVEQMDEEKTSCDNIKEGTSSTAYKQKFKDLNTPEKYSLDHETGFFEKEINGVKQYVDGVPDGTSHLNTPEDAMNGTHVHNNILKTYEGTNLTYDAQIKILSPGDLVNLIKLMQNNNSNPTNTFTVMISNEGIYSITLLESITWTLELRNNFLKLKKDYIKTSEFIANNYITMTSEQRKDHLEKEFLKLLKDIGLENKISLFEGEIENEIDPNIDNYNIKWTQKKLKKIFLGYDVESIPCN
jgi:uncharacterized membrane protein YgcG